MRKMKRLKFYVSMLLTACLTLSIPAQAAVNRMGTQEKIPTVGTAEREKEYAKGQAMILYRESAAARSSILANSLGEDMQIDETYEFKDTDKGTDVRISAQAAKNSKVSDLGTLKVSLVKSDIYSTEELIKKLSARKDVLAAEPNYRIHTLDQGQDPYGKFQWAIDNQGQNHGTIGFDVNPEQDILGGSEGEECVIALVDTGIDYTHEDLKNVVWNNPINSSQLRGSHGFDFINYDADPMDDNGHGTHCSGIMAAEWNNAGIRGISKNPKIKIMGLKILDEDGSGWGMEFAGAYNYIYKAQQLGVNVVAVNNSWGGIDDDESVIFKTLIDLVGEKGAVSVCAAGNESFDNDIIQSLPASIDSNYIISVAASNENDELAAFSNYGAESVDIAAPGADILSSVSYDCFNPGIYEDKSALCSVFEDFSDGKLVQAVSADDGEIAYGYAKGKGKAKVSLSLSDEAYFGLCGGSEKSLKWTINGAKSGDIYTIYFPYMAGVSSTDSHSSVMVKAVAPAKPAGSDKDDDEFLEDDSVLVVNDLEMEEDGRLETRDEMELIMGSVGGFYVDEGNYWNHITGVAHEETDEAGRRAIAVSLIVSKDGNYEVYLDNMGVSKENTAPDKFGKYDYYNGTSMATPYVTGAAAVIAFAYPEEDAWDRAQHVLGCTRKSSALNGKVATGGVLDLSGVGLPNSYLKNIALDKNKNIRIEGKGLSGAAVTINSQAVTPKQQSQDEIILNSAGLWNKSLNIAVTVGEKVLTQKCFFADGAGFKEFGRASGWIGTGYAVSDGEQIYYVDEEGSVSNCMPNQEDEMGEIMWFDGFESYSTELFGMDENLLDDESFSIYNLSEIICLDGKLWTVLELDLKYSEERILACYDSLKGWKAASKLPEGFENMEGMSIAAYQGKLYLLGGLDNATGDLQTCVKKMDPLTMKWEAGIELPEARAFAQAVATGDKLVLTLGKNQQNTVPQNMIFDGKSWSVSKAELKGISEDNFYYYLDAAMNEQEVCYYSGFVGAIKGGLVYSGLQAENLGDTFCYELSSDKYVKTNYAVCNTSVQQDVYYTVVMQDKLYLLAKEKGEIHIFTMPVQSPCVEVFDTNRENEEIERGYLTGIKHYMPGDVINVTAEPYEDCYVKQLTVDGVKVAKGADGKYSYRSVVNTARSRIPVSAVFGAYVTDIIMDENISLYPGQSYPLYPLTLPERADNQKLTWSSSKPGTVSVNKNGMLTVSKKAKKGSTVVITAIAQDRKIIKASCKVTVTSAPLAAKNDIVSSGKLEYKVTASSAKKKEVTCNGFSGKAMTSVKIPDSIKINGYTYKVTGIAKNAFAKNKNIKSVTIGKNVTSIGQSAFLNCKSLKTVQIKGTSLKTVGKNAFKGLDKKAIVKVPKKQKKSYASKLKKAGYSGKIK